MSGRYDQLLRAMKPCPIDEQIKAMVQQIEITGAYLERQLERGQIHPEAKAARMHRLRSILLTLQAEQQRQARPAPAQEHAA